MSDLKTCPFCLEEIPSRAIKCRFCESMVDELGPGVAPAERDTSFKSPSKAPTPVAASRRPMQNEEENLRRATGQSGYYQAVSGNKKKRSYLVPVLIVLAILLLGGGGVAALLMVGDNGEEQLGEAVALEDLVGDSWRQRDSEDGVYFQFLPNEMVNVAVPDEGYWFRTQYRVIRSEPNSYLELYHRGLAEWERNAELTLLEDDTLLLTDTFAGVVMTFERVDDSEFREMINGLSFER